MRLLHGQLFAPLRDQLIEQRDTVAHRAPRETRQQRQASWVDSDLLLIDDHRQPRRDRSRLDPTEVEPLAAGGDRQRDFVRFGRRQHKDDVWRRLLERLQQGVEGLRRQHVRLIDDVDLDLQNGRQILHPFPQVTDFVDAAVGGGIDLDQVDGRAASDLDAVRADAARLRALEVQTVDRLGQDPGGRRLPGASYAGEEIGMRHAALLHRVLQRLGNRILPDQLAKFLGAVLVVKGLVGHAARKFYGPAEPPARLVYTAAPTPIAA